MSTWELSLPNRVKCKYIKRYDTKSSWSFMQHCQATLLHSPSLEYKGQFTMGLWSLAFDRSTYKNTENIIQLYVDWVIDFSKSSRSFRTYLQIERQVWVCLLNLSKMFQLLQLNQQNSWLEPWFVGICHFFFLNRQKDSDKRRIRFIVKRNWKKIFILLIIAGSGINAKIDEKARIMQRLWFLKAKFEITKL